MNSNEGTVFWVRDIADPSAPTVAELEAATPIGFCYGDLDLSGATGDDYDWGPLQPLPTSYSTSVTFDAAASEFIAYLFGIPLHHWWRRRPRHGPPPLPINGHDYHRRRRNRR